MIWINLMIATQTRLSQIYWRPRYQVVAARSVLDG
jgi:hypothetical protein